MSIPRWLVAALLASALCLCSAALAQNAPADDPAAAEMTVAPVEAKQSGGLGHVGAVLSIVGLGGVLMLSAWVVLRRRYASKGKPRPWDGADTTPELPRFLPVQAPARAATERGLPHAVGSPDPFPEPRRGRRSVPPPIPADAPPPRRPKRSVPPPIPADARRSRTGA